MPARDGALHPALAPIAAAVAPPCASDAAPPWLRPGQHVSFARALAALRIHGAACLADPVGSGKTYVALAVAAALRHDAGGAPAVCLVPAALASQWERAARSTGVTVSVHSHERLSRGRLPPRRSRLVIIDESHRLRNAATRRYTTVAPWLVGCRVLLVTATPVVNRPSDLLAQLRLGARDDTIAAFGVASLTALLTAGHGHPALSRLVVRSGDAAASRPRRAVRSCPAPRDAHTPDLAAGLLRLRLSSAPDVAALVRVGLLRALSSSRPALRRALVRYRTLLQHAADAADGGRAISRRELRSAVGGDESQMVLWELLEPRTAAEAVELEPDDLPALGSLLARVRAIEAAAPLEPKMRRLAEIVADGRRTIVFVSHTATVSCLRTALAAHRPAWCTGSAAGVGPLRAARGAVLAAFDPQSSGPPAADLLIATDVAAEGLNLQRAERIVHYDLPWSPTRLRQREGRAVRLGSPHARVEIVSFRAHPSIERSLGMEAVLRAKEAWPARMGLTERPRRSGRPTSEGPPHASSAASPGADLFVVAEASDPRGHPLERRVLWLRPDGVVTGDTGAIAERLRSFACSEVAPAADCGHRELLAAGADALRRHLSVTAAPHARPPVSIVQRLTRLGAAAARARDPVRAAAVERALAFVRRGHTAGEAKLLADLAGASPRGLLRLIDRLPAEPPASAWRVVLAVRVEPARERVVRFAPCSDTTPCSSISTARS